MKNKLCILLLFLSIGSLINAQVELVPVQHNVYDFLKRMQVKGIIPGYNSSSLPIDRRTVYNYMEKILAAGNTLSSTEMNSASEMISEFRPEAGKKDSLNYSFLNTPSFSEIFSNSKRKYIYSFADENVSFYVDGLASLSYRNFDGDSYNTSLLLGELGMRLRGTLYNNLGFYLRLSNGQQVGGDESSRPVAAKFDPRLSSNVKFLNEKYYDSFEGYLRYSTGGWFSITAGREALSFGFGYSDKLFLGQNTVPFDFLKVDLNYGVLGYSFYYGNVKGDSLGYPINSKNIVGNQLSFNFNRIKFGFFETIIIADRPLSFTYLNPVSFLISADFTSQNKNDNNAILGFNFEIIPFDNFSLQGTLLIDDLDFKTLFTDESKRDNKFGIQAGLIWHEFLTIPNLKLTAEYTRIDPFVYTHRTNKVSYTHWNLPLGNHLNPNSDEIFASLDYYLSHRIKINTSFAFQRSAGGNIISSSGEMIRNYGGDLLRGDGDLLYIPKFLNGNRINKSIFSVNLYIEPIRQYYLNIHYSRINQDILYQNKTKGDNILYITAGVDF